MGYSPFTFPWLISYYSSHSSLTSKKLGVYAGCQAILNLSRVLSEGLGAYCVMFVVVSSVVTDDSTGFSA